MEHICQTCIKNIPEAKLQKTAGIKGKLRKNDVSKKQKKQSQLNWLPLGLRSRSP